MTNTPSVAAIVPTMNRAERLDTALASVFAQTYRPLEAIVVDGGSTDRTPSVVSRYRNEFGDDRITYLRNDEPQGLPAARNQAAAVTDATFLAFLDDDDRWHPEKIERQVAQFRARDCEIGLSYTGRVSRTESGEHVHTVRPSVDGDAYRELLVHNAIGSPSRVMVTADAFDAIDGFEEELKHQEDWDLYIRMAKKYEVGCILAPLVTRLSHRGGMSADVTVQKAYGERLLDRYRSELRTHGVYDAAWAALHREAGIAYAQSGNTAMGRRELREALRYETTLRGVVSYALALFGPLGFRLGTQIKRTLERAQVLKRSEPGR
jgi:glycosyltransferase involved in cell wall biosynthesis